MQRRFAAEAREAVVFLLVAFHIMTGFLFLGTVYPKKQREDEQQQDETSTQGWL